MKMTLYFTLTLITYVTLTFVPNSFAQDKAPEYVVRVIYFIPTDREPQPDIDEKLEKVIIESQQYYAWIMRNQGFGNKTFKFEADDNGNVVVHHVNGKFNDAYYQNPLNGSWIVWNEIKEQFDMSKNIYLLALESSNDYLDGNPVIIGRGSGNGLNGRVILPASYTGADFHELGHAFGLLHDRRAYPHLVLSYSLYKDPMTRSFMAAEWLDVNRYFNSTQETFNENTQVKMLSPSLAAPPINIRLQFEVTDPDGLHQAQLFMPYGSDPRVIANQSLSNESATVEFVTNELVDGRFIVLRVIDKHGNFTSHRFPIEIGNLLTPTEEISIPDMNLEKSLRSTLGLAPNQPITQLDMSRLNRFFHRFSRVDTDISDFTGLEFAKNLRMIEIDRNPISDFDTFTKLTNLEILSIRNIKEGDIPNDFSPLAKLTNLRILKINGCSLRDISSLAKLTNLEKLDLNSNLISDISPLQNLTKLDVLYLGSNRISDISPLQNLTKLQDLRIYLNQISDIRPLQNLTKLDVLHLNSNQISDIRPLQNLTKLDDLNLMFNQISDISPLKNLTELRILLLIRNKISDISSLENLTELTNLRLEDNRIRDIKPLTRLINLSTLILLNNQISDITSLSGLTNLRDLRLSGNQISDTIPLTGLVKLRLLYLYDNPIKNRKPLFELLQKNPALKIYLERDDGPLPVTLSHFRAEHTNNGVILKWTTESEVDNAGFYIYRSETKDGKFKVVNPTMVQGAGTTGKRNNYTWTDTTAKPNTVYYYRIEDVSHAGVREQLATVRLRGLVSARGKLTTIWADLKEQK